MAKITITVIPVEGKKTKVEVEATGATLKEVLKKAEIGTNFNFEVDGRPATLDTFIEAGSEVKVKATEKVRGS